MTQEQEQEQEQEQQQQQQQAAPTKSTSAFLRDISHIPEEDWQRLRVMPPILTRPPVYPKDHPKYDPFVDPSERTVSLEQYTLEQQIYKRLKRTLRVIHTSTNDPQHTSYYGVGSRGIEMQDSWNQSIVGEMNALHQFMWDLGLTGNETMEELQKFFNARIQKREKNVHYTKANMVVR
jgi:hypothetical protein